MTASPSCYLPQRSKGVAKTALHCFRGLRLITKAKQALLFVFVVGLLSTPGLSAEALLAPCWTTEGDGMCGQAATSTETLSCPDGSSGPKWIRTSAPRFKCVRADPGSAGNKTCDNNGTTVEETLVSFGCVNDNYAQVSSIAVQSCPSAKLKGRRCNI